MFKYLLILAVIPMVLCMSEEMQKMVAELRANCMAESGVDKSLLDIANEKKILTDDESLKCYIKCILLSTGMMSDNGDIDVEQTIALITEELRDELAPTVRRCGTVRGSNMCETAWLTHKCYTELKPDGYYLV